MLARTLHLAWRLLAAMLLLAAVALTAGRLWVPTLAVYRADVEAHAAEVLEKSVRIGRMQGSWRGLGPVLKLQDVVISEPDRPRAALAVAEVWIGIDLRHLVDDDYPLVRSVDVLGAGLSVTREADGRLVVNRLEFDGGGEIPLQALLGVDRLSLHDTVLTWEDRQAGRPAMRLSDVTLTLDNRGRRPQLTGYALLPPELGYRVDLSAEIRPHGAGPEGWGGRLYLQGQALEIREDNLLSLASDVNISGTADLRGWLNFRRGRLEHVRGELEINALRLHQQGEDAVTDYNIDRFAGRFGWRTRADGWQFAAQDLVVAVDGRERHGAGLVVSRHEHADGAHYAGEITEIYLEDVQALARSAPGVPEAWRHRLAQLQPAGRIEKLYLDARQAGGQYEVAAFDMTFRDLGVRPADGPGFSGLRGSISGTPEAGALWLRSRNAAYRDDGLFRGELRFEHVTGELGWQRRDGVLELAGRDLRLVNGDLDVGGTLDLAVPDGEAAPDIGLRLAVHRGRLDGIRRYLPAGIMPKTGVAWLDRALVGGDIRDGRVLVEGPLDKLPFDGGEGRLEVDLPVRDAELFYNPKWSPIRQLAAQVSFRGRSMEVTSRAGRIRSAALAGVTARIGNLARPDLEVDGTIRGDLPVMLAELGYSPLGEKFGGFTDRVTGAGRTTLDLELFIPLHGRPRRADDVRGTIHLADNGLQVDDTNIGFSGISGTLSFDTAGITGESLRARLQEAPVRVDVWTDAAEAVTNIRIRGAPDLVALLADGRPALAGLLDGLLEGRSDWDARLQIARLQGRREIPRIDLLLRSGLEGIRVDLPEPFGKAAQDSRALSVTVGRIAHPEHTLELSYGNELQGIFAVGREDAATVLRRGHLLVGNRSPALPETAELLVSGHLERFALDEWQPLWSRSAGGGGLPLELELVLDRVELLRHELTGVGLHLDERGSERQLKLAGPTVSGTVRIERGARGPERVTAELDLLKLRPTGDAAGPAGAAAPDDLPELDIVIRQLKYDGMNLGSLQLSTRSLPGSVRVERLDLDAEMLSLEASGDWQQQGGRQVSQFDVDITGGLLEKLLREFDYKEEVSGGNLGGSLRASWPGAPWDFRPAALEGKLHLVIRDGQLLNVKPGAGRVFGLVSLHTLPRRLSLDFSDLFKKGYAFDRIEGHFVLSDGDAYTNDLYIDGPAARIDITGRIGIRDQDYDELVTVVPHVSSSLPIAGAIAGGPVVGAALLVAEHLLGDELEKRTKFAHKQYTVTGSWQDAVFAEVENIPEEEEGAADADEPVYEIE